MRSDTVANLRSQTVEVSSFGHDFHELLQVTRIWTPRTVFHHKKGAVRPTETCVDESLELRRRIAGCGLHLELSRRIVTAVTFTRLDTRTSFDTAHPRRHHHAPLASPCVWVLQAHPHEETGAVSTCLLRIRSKSCVCPM